MYSLHTRDRMRRPQQAVYSIQILHSSLALAVGSELAQGPRTVFAVKFTIFRSLSIGCLRFRSSSVFSARSD
jgi:hypothetical protein